MSRDVNFSVASVLAEFNSPRRAESKASEGKASEENRFSPPEDREADRPNFDRLVADQAARSRAAEHANGRMVGHSNDRMMPERPARNDRPVAEETPTPCNKKADIDDRVACDGPKPAKREDSTVSREDGDKKSTESDVAGQEAGATEEQPACVGHVSPARPEDVDVKVSEEILPVETGVLTEGFLGEIFQTTEATTAVNVLTVAAGAEMPVAAEGGEGSLLTQIPGAAVASAEGELVVGVADAAAKVAGVQNAETIQAKVAIAAEAVAKAAAPAILSDAEIALAKAGDPAAKTTAEVAGAASSGETSGIAKPEDSEGSEGVATKSVAPNLHPTRAAVFADFLEGFGGSNAIHRPADILAGLDRTVVASALNRGGEVSRPTPLQMLPIEIGMQAVRGVTNFQIRLDPAELGRVDVKLQIRENGEVNASLVVDRVETLQMLKRDASTLQYAFEQAGLKQSADGLTFSLRGEGQNGQQERGQPGHSSENPDELALQAQLGEAVMRRVLIPNSSIDRMV